MAVTAQDATPSKGDRTRQRLLEIAVKRFAADGYRRTSVSDIARDAGLTTGGTHWCGVDWLTMESLAHKNIHVLGDATLSAPAMPKSGHMANNQGKLAAAAIIELMNGREPNPHPVIANTCYSFVSDREVIHVASVHRFDPEHKTMVVVPGTSGVSPARSELEATYAWGWAQNIWADTLG